MYRSAAKRCFHAAALRRRCTSPAYPTRRPPLRFASSATSDLPPNPNPNPFESTATSASRAAEDEKSEANQERASRDGPRAAHYEQQQARVLSAALNHVSRLGWTEAAMMAGARDVGISPSIVGAFPRKEAALVEFFMDESLQRLIDIIDSDESLRSLTPSHRIAKLVRIRLEMQAPYISKWAQVLSIQAHPLNVPTSFKQRAMLIDEIWHAVDDNGTDVDWYAKRTILGGVYCATELYMLTDTSLGFRNTWEFLDKRIRDAFDLKKTAQEAKYLAEAVTAGMGNSFPGFFSKVFQR